MGRLLQVSKRLEDPMLQITRTARISALTVAALALTAGVSVAQFRQTGGAGIKVFDDVNFQGAPLTVRGDIPDLRNVRFNDRISSLQVPPGESWELCADVNYAGRCVVVSGSERDLRTQGFNDVISSMRLVSRGDRGGRFDRGARDDRGGMITVWDDVNFQGQPMTIRGEVPDLRDINFNDRISSFQVGPGESWEVCENVNFGGRCTVVSGSERDLRPLGWNDIVTSMRPVRGGGNRGSFDDRGGVFGRPPAPSGEIVLFDQLGYRGAAQNVTGAAAGLGAFANRAQSVQILNGDWELCEQTQWNGRCVRVSGSVPDLGRIGLRSVASARPIDLIR
jgi:hypothetical protein